MRRSPPGAKRPRALIEPASGSCPCGNGAPGSTRNALRDQVRPLEARTTPRRLSRKTNSVPSGRVGRRSVGNSNSPVLSASASSRRNCSARPPRLAAARPNVEAVAAGGERGRACGLIDGRLLPRRGNGLEPATALAAARCLVASRSRSSSIFGGGGIRGPRLNTTFVFGFSMSYCILFLLVTREKAPSPVSAGDGKSLRPL